MIDQVMFWKFVMGGMALLFLFFMYWMWKETSKMGVKKK